MKQAVGFTLIEVLSALLFIGIVAGALFSVFETSIKHRAAAVELENARAWLQAELTLQRTNPIAGNCQSEDEAARAKVACTVFIEPLYDKFSNITIVLSDSEKEIGRVIGVVEGTL